MSKASRRWKEVCKCSIPRRRQTLRGYRRIRRIRQRVNKIIGRDGAYTRSQELFLERYPRLAEFIEMLRMLEAVRPYLADNGDYGTMIPITIPEEEGEHDA